MTHDAIMSGLSSKDPVAQTGALMMMMDKRADEIEKNDPDHAANLRETSKSLGRRYQYDDSNYFVSFVLSVGSISLGAIGVAMLLAFIIS